MHVDYLGRCVRYDTKRVITEWMRFFAIMTRSHDSSIYVRGSISCAYESNIIIHQNVFTVSAACANEKYRELIRLTFSGCFASSDWNECDRQFGRCVPFSLIFSVVRLFEMQSSSRAQTAHSHTHTLDAAYPPLAVAVLVFLQQKKPQKPIDVVSGCHESAAHGSHASHWTWI